MFRKFLAAVSTLALALGMVAVTAGPAAAHQNTISASVSCNPGTEGTWKVTWYVVNSEGDKSEEITASSDAVLIPVGTTIPAGTTATFDEYYSAKPSSNKTLSLSAQWSNGVTSTDDGTLKKKQFSDDCLADDTDHKVEICHYDNGQGGKYTLNDVDYASVIKGTGHGAHGKDIIPPFSYTEKGVPGSYPGQNWDTYGQWLYDNDCSDEVIPAIPTFADARCTGPGTWGQGSYTVPATTGVEYQVKIGLGGGWATESAGTYPVSPVAYVQIKAVALDGYDLQGRDGDWKWADTIGRPADCEEDVTPVEPTFSDDGCTGPGESSGATFTIPDVEGVQYQLKGLRLWHDVAPGTYPVVLFGTVEVRAVAESGYDLIGTTSWEHEFVRAGLCLVHVTPEPPVIEQPTCDAPGEVGQGNYTIPDITGVNYSVKVNDGVYIDVAPGIYPLDVGDMVRILATGDFSEGYYILDGLHDQLFGPFEIVAPDGGCIEDAVVVAPTASPQVCEVDPQDGSGSYVDGYITIVASPGVDYFIDGNPAAAGDHPLPPGSYTVTAEPQFGHTLSGYPAGGWERTIGTAEPCGDLVTFPLVTPTVSFAQISCDAAGSYTLGNEEGFSGAILWTVVTGPNSEGTHTVADTQTVTVTAAPNAPDYGFASDQQTVWEYEFVTPDACGDLTTLPFPGDDLTTLALTGGAVAWGWVNIAGIAVGVGILLLVARRREVTGTE